MNRRTFITALLLGLLVSAWLAPRADAAPMPRSKVKRELIEACDFWRIPKGERAWVIGAGLHIVRKESTFDPLEITGTHVGLWQFNERWRTLPALINNAKRAKHPHGRLGWRACPDCSTKRFVYAYKQGGKRFIRSSSGWQQTVGGW